MRFALGILLVSATMSVAADPKSVSKKFEPLQGTWKVTSRESDGVDDLDGQKGEVVIKGKKMTLTLGDRKPEEFLIEIDSSKSPHTINLYNTKAIGIGIKDGVEERTEFHGKYFYGAGIYEVDGRSLKICLAYKKKTRPTDFVTKGKPERDLYILTRQKEVAESPIQAEGKPVTK